MGKHKKKYGKVKGLILDVRKNSGGLFNQAIAVSDMFISKGVLVRTRGRGQSQEEVVYATQADTLEGFPIVTLIDAYSASASEILIGALQDNKRSFVMGTKSFGKGSVQSVVQLSDGSGLKLTVARYYTPQGRSIHDEGIEPDVWLKDIDIKNYEQALMKANKEGKQKNREKKNEKKSQAQKDQDTKKRKAA